MNYLFEIWLVLCVPLFPLFSNVPSTIPFHGQSLCTMGFIVLKVQKHTVTLALVLFLRGCTASSSSLLTLNETHDLEGKS